MGFLTEHFLNPLVLQNKKRLVSLFKIDHLCVINFRKKFGLLTLRFQLSKMALRYVFQIYKIINKFLDSNF